jgi:signal transduction histidine kinase
VGVFIVLLLAGIGVLAHSRRSVRRASAAQLSVSRRLLQAQDEERVRIARDLHDDLCQDMTMLALDMSRLPDDSPYRTLLATRVHGLIDRTRSIAVGLHATHVGRMPFPDALATHTAGLQERAGLDIRIEIAQWEVEPSPAAALALFRAVQESLQNVIRHADASTVTVRLAATDREIRLEVTDDGIGFEPARRADTGLGLSSMRERMVSIGGTFAIRSTPFAGTTIELTAPTVEARA